MIRLSSAALLLLGSAACRTAPAGPIPDPLPQALPWTLAEVSEQEGAFLGIKARENTSGSLDDLFFEPGARVTEVVDGSPAAEAGFLVGDVVLLFEARPIDAPEDLDVLLREVEPGSAVTMEVRRDDTLFEVTCTLRAAGGGGVSEVRELYRLDPVRSRAAWATGPRGVVLVSVADDSPMRRAGLQPGTVVLSVDGQEVLSDHGFIRRLESYEPGTRVELELLEESGATRTKRVRLYESPRVTTWTLFPFLWRYNADPSRDRQNLVIGDIYFFWLFRYRRDGGEKRWSILRFIQWSSGVGELVE